MADNNTHSNHRAPDTRDLFVQEFEVTLTKSGETTTIQYFCNRDNEPVYFPDRTLSALFQVNLSTLRGRFNRMTKKHEGYRLLISEKSKTRLSSLHFINWGSEHFLDNDCSRSASPLHGLVALNHIILVNYALSEWIAYNHERLGTSLSDIESNLKKVHLPYTRNNNVITIQQKRSLTALHNPSSFYRHTNHRDRLIDHKLLGPPCSSSSSSSSPCHHKKNDNAEYCQNCNTGDCYASNPASPPPPPSRLHHSIGIKRSNPNPYDGHYDYDSSSSSQHGSPSSTPSSSRSPSPPLSSSTSLSSSSSTRYFSGWEALNGVASRKLPRLRSSSSPPPLSSSTTSSPPTSPLEPYLVDNTIQCTIEGETVCHRVDLSCLDSFSSLRSALSSLFRLNSFHILYQSVLDPIVVELREVDDYETYHQFRSIVKKVIVKPFSVTPALKNLLW